MSASMNVDPKVESVGIDELTIYPEGKRCTDLFSDELCIQLEKMRKTANALNSNITGLVQEFEEKLEEIEKYRIAAADGDLKAQKIMEELDNEKDILQDELDTLKDFTIPSVNQYMSKINTAVGRKRKLQEVTKTPLTIPRLFSLLVGAVVKQAEKKKEMQQVSTLIEKFRKGFYRSQNLNEEPLQEFIRRMKTEYQQSVETVDEPLFSDLQSLGTQVLTEYPTYNDRLRTFLRAKVREYNSTIQ